MDELGDEKKPQNFKASNYALILISETKVNGEFQYSKYFICPYGFITVFHCPKNSFILFYFTEGVFSSPL